MPREPMDDQEFEYLTRGQPPAMREHLREIYLCEVRLHQELASRRDRRRLLVVMAIDLAEATGGFWLIWPGHLGHLPIVAHIAVGVLFGSWLGHRWHWWRQP